MDRKPFGALAWNASGAQPDRSRGLAGGRIGRQMVRKSTLAPNIHPAAMSLDHTPKSCVQALGEAWPRAIRSGTGRGGDVTGSRNSFVARVVACVQRCFNVPSQRSLALAVATAGRPSPSETH